VALLDRIRVICGHLFAWRLRVRNEPIMREAEQRGWLSL